MYDSNRKILFLVSICCLCHVKTISASKVIEPAQDLISYNSDPILIGIQAEIHNAFSKSIKHNDNSYLLDVKTDIIKKNWEVNSRISIYWSSYLNYYMSLYHFKKGDYERSETEIDLGVKLLDSVIEKNTED
jgi:hypothetical protein